MKSSSNEVPSGYVHFQENAFQEVSRDIRQFRRLLGVTNWQQNQNAPHIFFIGRMGNRDCLHRQQFIGAQGARAPLKNLTEGARSDGSEDIRIRNICKVLSLSSSIFLNKSPSVIVSDTALKLFGTGFQTYLRNTKTKLIRSVYHPEVEPFNRERKNVAQFITISVMAWQQALTAVIMVCWVHATTGSSTFQVLYGRRICNKSDSAYVTVHLSWNLEYGAVFVTWQQLKMIQEKCFQMKATTFVHDLLVFEFQT